jgi:hypothetical protein
MYNYFCDNVLVSAHALHSVSEFNGSHIAIKLIEVQSITKHPDNESQGALVSDFLLIVKEMTDDITSSANFWVRGQFNNPRNFKFDSANKLLSFQHETEKNTKTTSLFVEAKGITVR